METLNLSQVKYFTTVVKTDLSIYDLGKKEYPTSKDNILDAYMKEITKEEYDKRND